MTQQHRRMRTALAALGSVTLTAGILATSAPAAHANGDDDDRRLKVTADDQTARVKHVDCDVDFDVVTKGFEDERLGTIAFFAIEPSAERQPLFSDVGVNLSGAPGPERNEYISGNLGLDALGTPSVINPQGDDVHILVEVKTKNGKTWRYKFWLGANCDVG